MSVKLDHVHITVRNIDESIEWYNKLFGFQKVEGGTSEQGKKWAIVAFQDSMIAMSEYPTRASGDQITDSNHAIYHFGLRVPDANEWRNKVKTHNLKLYRGGEVEYPHSRSWYVHDPSGHQIEISWNNGEAMRFPEEAASIP